MAIEKFLVKEQPGVMGGTQSIYRFENGFGASVIKEPIGMPWKFELVVLKFVGDDSHFYYHTLITRDVLRMKNQETVDETLRRIQRLDRSGKAWAE